MSLATSLMGAGKNLLVNVVLFVLEQRDMSREYQGWCGSLEDGQLFVPAAMDV